MHNLEELLRSNPYPGRGMVIGKSLDGKRSITVYFIMGRSANSRNRVFEKTDDGIKTAAFDETRMEDPSLIIYRPVRVAGGLTIVSNGDQTDTIWEYMTRGDSYHAALETRDFEPDAPNYTPRISAIVQADGSYAIAIIKTAEGNPQHCLRFFYEYPKDIDGTGHLISTYRLCGMYNNSYTQPAQQEAILPSFYGEPVAVTMNSTDDIDKFANEIWDSLNEDNKVALYVRAVEISTGRAGEIIINKHVR